jgi:hypothetical protein
MSKIDFAFSLPKPFAQGLKGFWPTRMPRPFESNRADFLKDLFLGRIAVLDRHTEIYEPTNRYASEPHLFTASSFADYVGKKRCGQRLRYYINIQTIYSRADRLKNSGLVAGNDHF